MRFRLRTLFVVVTFVAVAVGWLVSQREWVRNRAQAAEWANLCTRCNIRAASSSERLPFGLWILGARPIECFEIDVDYLRDTELYRVEQLRNLFSEASVIVKHGRTQTDGGNPISAAVIDLIDVVADCVRALDESNGNP